MQLETRTAIKEALKIALSELKAMTPVKDTHWVYHRDTPSANWAGTQVTVPSIDLHFFYLLQWDKLAQAVEEKIISNYPDYHQQLIYITMGMQFSGEQMIRGLTSEIWQRYQSFTIEETKIDSLLDELALFFDTSTVELEFLAPILNMERIPNISSIQFPGNLTLRALTSEEATRIYGGSLTRMTTSGSTMINMPQMVLEGTVIAKKFVGGDAVANFQHSTSSDIEMRKKLDQALLAICSFEEGGIAYDGFHLRPKIFCPVPVGGSHHPHSEWIPPMHSFRIRTDEIESFTEHVKHFENLHSSLEFACRRLLYAERRLQARDRILDAVIGLEAIFLQDMTDDKKYRSEITYRLSMNYSSLFNIPSERYDAFKTMRDLYRVRSEIGHGEPIQDSDLRKINGRDTTLGDAAALATSILRKTIKNFLPNSANPGYLEGGFWIKKIFGLESAS